MRLLFIGDVFGNIGRRVLSEYLQPLIDEHEIEVVIANGENVAGGKGVTARLSQKLFRYGVDIITGGNHSLATLDSREGLESSDMILRPLNLPKGNPGIGKTLYTMEDGRQVGVINLLGRTFLNETPDCPFRLGLEAVNELRKETPIIIIDFHAEATSEKIALASYLDGKISALLGTHTHVQTADERILSGGTAFITDAGMTGAEDSAIGVNLEQVIKKFRLQCPVRFEPAENNPMLNGVIFDIDDATGHAISISRIYKRIMFK